MTAGGRDPRTWQLTLYACPAEKKLHSRTIFARIGGTETNNGYLCNKIALNMLNVTNINILTKPFLRLNKMMTTTMIRIFPEFGVIKWLLSNFWTSFYSIKYQLFIRKSVQMSNNHPKHNHCL